MSDIKIPPNVLNEDKYKEAYKIANETYKRPSAYKSMFIVRKYKELGGKYKETQNSKEEEKTKPKTKSAKERTEIWREEQWVQIKPYIENDVAIACGEGDKPKACRPLKKVKGGDKNLTMEDIIKKWGHKKVLELTEQKLDDMDGRLDWKKGTFTPSKDRARVRRQKKEENK